MCLKTDFTSSSPVNPSQLASRRVSILGGLKFIILCHFFSLMSCFNAMTLSHSTIFVQVPGSDPLIIKHGGVVTIKLQNFLPSQLVTNNIWATLVSPSLTTHGMHVCRKWLPRQHIFLFCVLFCALLLW